ncbi:MAG: hypothetical protein FJ139_01675 [Deltaproteobacteria bacterium]|nr:hypothetical protein [Deltaproteobacteria bacterium]
MIATPLDELIYRRRSIRKYREESPPEEWIKSMILAAMRAPSPSNTQPVRFIRLRSPHVTDLLHQAMREGRDRLLRAASEADGSKRAKNWINYYYRYSKFMFHAPVLFAVGTLSRHNGFTERLGKTGLKIQYQNAQKDLDISVGLSLYGYLLKAEELGLGACILTAPLAFIENPEKILSLEQIEIRCFVTTGYPDEEASLSKRKDISEIYREI